MWTSSVFVTTSVKLLLLFLFVCVFRFRIIFDAVFNVSFSILTYCGILFVSRLNKCKIKYRQCSNYRGFELALRCMYEVWAETMLDYKSFRGKRKQQTTGITKQNNNKNERIHRSSNSITVLLHARACLLPDMWKLNNPSTSPFLDVVNELSSKQRHALGLCTEITLSCVILTSHATSVSTDQKKFHVIIT